MPTSTTPTTAPGAKVYVGEYAVTQGCGQGNLRAALGEAAFMTGMERNSDVVVMASYAPLFVNVHYKKWNPDLIDFDSSRVYGIPSYYVQQMFSENRGDVVLPVTVTAPEVAPAARAGAIGVGTWRTQAEFKDIKVTRGDETLFACDFADGTQGLAAARRRLDGGGRRPATEGAGGQRPRVCRRHDLERLHLQPQGPEAGRRRRLPDPVPGQGRGSQGVVEHRRLGQHPARHRDGGHHRRTTCRAASRPAAGMTSASRCKGANVKCFLDGKLIHDVSCQATKPLYAVASLAKRANEVILKVVNVSAADQETDLRLEGARVRPGATAIVLASDKPEDENTLDQPTKVKPVTLKLNDAGAAFRHTFPANSVTVLRLKLQ